MYVCRYTDVQIYHPSLYPRHNNSQQWAPPMPKLHPQIPFPTKTKGFLEKPAGYNSGAGNVKDKYETLSHIREQGCYKD